MTARVNRLYLLTHLIQNLKKSFKTIHKQWIKNEYKTNKQQNKEKLESTSCVTHPISKSTAHRHTHCQC